MLGRVGPRAERVWGGTFHAVGNRFLRRHGSLVGLDPSFTVLDAGDAVELIGLVRTELGLAAERRPGGRRFPSADTIAAIASRVVNAQERLSDVVARHAPWCRDDVDAIRDVLVAVTERKRAQHVLDLDDLLLFWRALARAPEAAGVVAGAFDHVLVDEYQDTNALQADILDALCPGGARPHRRRRRRPGHLRLPGGHAAQHPRLRRRSTRAPRSSRWRPTTARRHRSSPSPTPSWPPPRPGHSSGKVLVAARPGRPPPAAAHLRRRGRPGRGGVRRGARPPRRGRRPAPPGGAVPRRLARRPARARAHPPQRPLREVRRAALPRGGPREGPAGPAARSSTTRGTSWRGPGRCACSTASGRPPPPASSTRSACGPRPTPAARLAAGPAARRAAGGARRAPARRSTSCARRWPTASALGAEPAPQVERLRRFLEPIVRHRYDSADARLDDLAQVEAAAAATAPGPRCSPTSPSTRRSPPATWPARPGSTTTGSRCPPCTRPRAASGTSCTSSTSPTAASRPTWPPARSRSWRRSAACSTWPCTRARNVLELSWPLRYHHNRKHPTDSHGWAQPSRFLTARRAGAVRRGRSPGRRSSRTEPVAVGAAVASVDALLDDLWR